MESKAALPQEQLEGFRVLANVCAEALMNVPSDAVVADVQALARALGHTGLDAVRADADLEQRYYDRFFVSSHPAFVPLYEDSVRDGFEDGDRFHYAETDGKRFEHVLKCYHAVGFDYRLIEGFDLSRQRLKPDSLTSELAFLSFLAQSACGGDNPAAAERASELLVEFAHDHANRWFGKAASCLKRFEDDFYAQVVSIAADAVSVVVPASPEGPDALR